MVMMLDYSEDQNDPDELYFQRDDLNSVHAVIGKNGKIKERYAYTAYGQTRILNKHGDVKLWDHDNDDQDDNGEIDAGLPGEGGDATPQVPRTSSEIGNPSMYAGMIMDEHTGLYMTHYRVYNPKMGRWLTPDPAGYRDGQNLYKYYGGANSVDPLGLSTDHHILNVFRNSEKYGDLWIDIFGQNFRVNQWSFQLKHFFKTTEEATAFHKSITPKQNEMWRKFGKKFYKAFYSADNPAARKAISKKYAKLAFEKAIAFNAKMGLNLSKVRNYGYKGAKLAKMQEKHFMNFLKMAHRYGVDVANNEHILKWMVKFSPTMEKSKEIIKSIGGKLKAGTTVVVKLVGPVLVVFAAASIGSNVQAGEYGKATWDVVGMHPIGAAATLTAEGSFMIGDIAGDKLGVHSTVSGVANVYFMLENGDVGNSGFSNYINTINSLADPNAGVRTDQKGLILIGGRDQHDRAVDSLK